MVKHIMKKYQDTHRDAIAMIELIFAIMIMGIVLMSAPSIIFSSTKSNITAFQQESIAIVAAHTNALMSYVWDESNTRNVNSGYILTVTTSDTELNQTNRGAITSNIDRVRKFSAGVLSASTIGSDAGDMTSDDVDDINGARSITLNLYVGAAQASNIGEYLDQNITITTTVAYVTDAAGYSNHTSFTYNTPSANSATTTNIKHIQATLTSASPDAERENKQITLHAFMCNIGAVKPQTDTF
jgi:hypothetical protein